MSGKRGLVPSNFIEKVADDELEDFHGLPLSMRNGHSIDGASPGSDVNEGIIVATSMTVSTSTLNLT